MFYSIPTSSVLFELQSGLFWELGHIFASQPWGQQSLMQGRSQGQLLEGKVRQYLSLLPPQRPKGEGYGMIQLLNCKCQISIFTSGQKWSDRAWGLGSPDRTLFLFSLGLHQKLGEQELAFQARRKGPEWHLLIEGNQDASQSTFQSLQAKTFSIFFHSVQVRSQTELWDVLHEWTEMESSPHDSFLLAAAEETNLLMCQSCKSVGELTRPPRSQAYQKLLPHPSRLNICRISLRHQVVLFTEAPPWWGDFQRYQTPNLSWTIAIPALGICGISVLSPFICPEAALTSACTSVSLCPFPRPSHHTINRLLQLKGRVQPGLRAQIDRFTNSILCLLSQMSASSYQVHAPSRLHKNLPKASSHLSGLHWPAEPIRVAQSALSLVLYPACLEMMRKCFGLLQTGPIFSFRNLNALLGFLLSASLSV